jgi:hypothetical protein
MAKKGRCAWLITWEGITANRRNEIRKGPRVVAVSSPHLGARAIKLLLKVLFCSEPRLTLHEKLWRGLYPIEPKKAYENDWQIGDRPFLYARKVKNLTCEESESDALRHTLVWTELAKYEFDNSTGKRKQIRPAFDDKYSYLRQHSR